MGGPLSYWLCPANRRSYSVGFDFVAALLRLLGRFRDFEAALLRTAGTFCSCPGVDACRFRDSSRSLRRFFSSRYLLNFL